MCLLWWIFLAKIWKRTQRRTRRQKLLWLYSSMVGVEGMVIYILHQGWNVDGNQVREWCERMGIEEFDAVSSGEQRTRREVDTNFQADPWCLLEERRIEKSNKTNWPVLLQEVTFVCNTLSNSSTGFSPHHLMYGTPLRTPVIHGLTSITEKACLQTIQSIRNV